MTTGTATTGDAVSARRRLGRAARGAAASLAFAVAALAGIGSAGAVSLDAILADDPPKELSAFGFFAEMAAQRPADGVVPYRLNTPLFSDAALKMRFVFVPAGSAASYRADEAFDFPVGTALVKTFAFPADYRVPEKDLRIIETRLLLRRADGWHALAYVWNDAQTEATLKVAGARVEVSTIDAEGAPLAFTYAVPNKNQCKGCHDLGGKVAPIGPKARNINGDFAYHDGAMNQIDRWTALGILAGAPSSAAAPAVPDFLDAGAPLEARARAWLDVNCAHCHRPEGPASNSGLFLTWGEADPVRYGVNKRPVAAGKGSGGLQFDIAPGDPDASILIYRVDSVEPGVMMPELGRHLPDPAAVALLRAWISAMK